MLDSKTGIPDERGNVSREQEALEHPAMDRLSPPLPGLHASIGCDTVLQKDQQTIGLQNARNAMKSLFQGRYRAKRERADDRVDAFIFQGDTFARQGQKLDIEGGSASFRMS